MNLNDEIDLSIPLSERNDSYREIKKVINALNSINSCNYFFSCGTALGVVREGKLLDWDTDIDIDIIEPSDYLVKNLIFQMKELGYSLYRTLEKANKFIQVVFVKRPYHSFDFCFWYEKKNYLINDVPETLFYLRKHPESLYKQFKYISVKNVEFKIPKDHNSYFIHLYGKDWRKPKRYSNWFSNASDLMFDFNLLRVLFKVFWKISKK